MFDNSINTRQQGDIGLAVAIAEFSKLNYTISIPLTDNSPYDLIVEKEGTLQKVQVKTSKYKNSYGNYEVGLRRIRSNKTQNKIHNFDNKETDLLFILLENTDCYLIPCEVLTVKSTITLGTKYGEYKIN